MSDLSIADQLLLAERQLNLNMSISDRELGCLSRDDFHFLFQENEKLRDQIVKLKELKVLSDKC